MPTDETLERPKAKPISRSTSRKETLERAKSMALLDDYILEEKPASADAVGMNERAEKDIPDFSLAVTYRDGVWEAGFSLDYLEDDICYSLLMGHRLGVMEFNVVGEESRKNLDKIIDNRELINQIVFDATGIVDIAYHRRNRKLIDKNKRPRDMAQTTQQNIAPAFSSVAAKDIGGMFYAARKASGMSQREVAQAMDTDTSFISKIENGKVIPSFETFEKFAQAIGMQSSVALTPL